MNLTDFNLHKKPQSFSNKKITTFPKADEEERQIVQKDFNHKKYVLRCHLNLQVLGCYVLFDVIGLNMLKVLRHYES